MWQTISKIIINQSAKRFPTKVIVDVVVRVIVLDRKRWMRDTHGPTTTTTTGNEAIAWLNGQEKKELFQAASEKRKAQNGYNKISTIRSGKGNLHILHYTHLSSFSNTVQHISQRLAQHIRGFRVKGKTLISYFSYFFLQ